MENTTLTPEEFDALPMREKAVLVAQDVIAQLDANKVISTRGCYINMRLSTVQNYSDSARDALLNGLRCNACQKGAILLSTVKLRNQLKIGKLDEWGGSVSTFTEEAIPFLSDIFSKRQLDLMEAIFEGALYYIGRTHDFNEEEFIKVGTSKLKTFIESFQAKKSEEVMREVMQNVIDNKGIYILPKDAFDYEEEWNALNTIFQA